MDSTKFGRDLLKRPKNSAINTYPRTMAHFYCVAFWAVLAPTGDDSIMNSKSLNLIHMESTNKQPKVYNAPEIEISYRNLQPPKDRITLTSARIVKEFIRDIWDDGKLDLQEEFKVILLNLSYEVLGVFNVHVGTMSSAQIDLKIIFGAVLKAASSKIILVHNHPSGNSKPSQADIALTNRMREIGNLLDIQVLDHFIITRQIIISFEEEGI